MDRRKEKRMDRKNASRKDDAVWEAFSIGCAVSYFGEEAYPPRLRTNPYPPGRRHDEYNRGRKGEKS